MSLRGKQAGLSAGSTTTGVNVTTRSPETAQRPAPQKDAPARDVRHKDQSRPEPRLAALEIKIARASSDCVSVEKYIKTLQDDLDKAQKRKMERESEFARMLQAERNNTTLLEAACTRLEQELGALRNGHASPMMSLKPQESRSRTNSSVSSDSRGRKDSGYIHPIGTTEDLTDPFRHLTSEPLATIEGGDSSSERLRPARSLSGSYNAEYLKQLIQQKYSSMDNIRSPYIHNLRRKTKQSSSFNAALSPPQLGDSGRLQTRNRSQTEAPTSPKELHSAVRTRLERIGSESDGDRSPKVLRANLSSSSATSERTSPNASNSSSATSPSESPQGSSFFERAPIRSGSNSGNTLRTNSPRSKITAALRASQSLSAAQGKTLQVSLKTSTSGELLAPQEETNEDLREPRKQKSNRLNEFKQMFSSSKGDDDSSLYNSPTMSPHDGSEERRPSVAALTEVLDKRPTKQELIDQNILKDEIQFGVSLDTFSEIPSVILKCTAFLDKQAELPSDLFTARADEGQINSLKRAFELGILTATTMQNQQPVVVAALLMRFLRELPEKLFAGISNSSQSFLWAQEVTILTLRYALFRSLLHKLAPNQRNTCVHILKWLRRLSDNGKGEIFLPSTLGQIFGPFFVQIHDTSRAALVVRKLIEDYKHVCLDAEPDIKYTTHQGVQCIKWASVERLIEKLMDPYFKDEQYVNVFLMTHTYFMSSMELLNRLIQFYTECKLGETKYWKNEMCHRVLQIVKIWLAYMSRANSVMDVDFMFTLSEFIDERVAAHDTIWAALKSVMANQQSPRARSDAFTTDELLMFSKSRRSTVSSETDANDADSNSNEIDVHRLREMDRSVSGISGSIATPPRIHMDPSRELRSHSSTNVPRIRNDVIEFDAYLLSQQLTYIDNTMYKAISLNELVNKNYADPKKSPNFAAMAEKFNEWGLWGISEIVRKDSLAARALTLSHFIDISKYCLDLRNFNTCCAILGGLNNSAIQRLRLTWEKVPKKTKQKYDEMMTIFDMTMNSKNYREMLKSKNPPAVPYLGLIPKDLTSAEEVPNYIEKGLVNMDKMRTIFKIVNDVGMYQEHSYPFKPNKEIQDKLRNLIVMEDEEAYQASLRVEPRQPEMNQQFMTT